MLAPRVPVSLAVAVVCGAVVAGTATAAEASAEKRAFNLPRGDAAVTLRQFAAAAGTPIVYLVDRVRGASTNAVAGEFTPREALERMLAGSALEAAQDAATGALVVSRKRTADAAPKKGEVGPVSDPQPKPPAKPMKSPRTFLTALAGWLAVAVAADAQTNVAAKKEDEAIILSPFVITTDKDNGYQATSTLAGTRIRTELKDIGTSITVITPEFLKDTGATDTRGLLTYVTGSEVGGLGGNFSAATIGPITFDPRNSGATRLRGLAAASEARNFYGTAIPLDSYNIERIEINRGANSILFGTGSPAGIINSSLKQAEMKNSYSVEGRYGSYESARGSFDINRQLVKGELAIRVIGLDKRQRFEQDFAFEDDARLYGAVTYDPQRLRAKNGFLSGTVLRASFERGDIDSRQPRALPPLDSVSGWFSPWFGNAPEKFSWDAGSLRTSSVVDGVNLFLRSPQIQTSNPAFRNAVVWFNDPTSSVPNTGSSINGVPIAGRQGVISNLPSPIPGTPLGSGLFASSPDITFSAGRTPGLLDASYYVRPSITDRSIFDYRTRLLEGPNSIQYANFEAYNGTFEQRFLNDRAGFELAFDRQRFRNGGNNLGAIELRIDINTTLLDGTINPNYGRPFVNGQWNSGYAENESKTGRATAFYRFDFADVVSTRWAKWLGKLTFTGLHEDGRSRAFSLGGFRFAPGADYIYGNNNLITDLQGGQYGQMSYVGPSLANASSARGAGIVGLTAEQIPTASAGRLFQFRNMTAAGTFVTVPQTYIDDGLVPSQLVTSANKTGNDTRAQAFVVQGKLLRDTLVATLGWRRDHVDAFTAATPRRGVRNNLIVDEAVWVLPVAPTLSASDETQSRSFVFHLPEKWVRKAPLASNFSLRYNTSENFSPSSARRDSNGRVLPSPTGTTRDVGFALGLADDRITLGATWYETKQNDVTAAGIGGLTSSILEAWRSVITMNFLGLNPNFAQVTAPPQALLDLYGFAITGNSATYIPRSDVVLTQDVVSKGVEFELVANVTPRWRLMFNAARQSASRSNTGAVFRELFFERKINGQTLYENWSGPVGQGTRIAEGGATLASQSVPNLSNAFNLQALQDGGPVPELRKWRANVVTNYTFSREGWLNGFGVGSGVRWQDKVAIGFPNITVNGIRVPDVTRPNYGPREWNVDSWVRYERRILGNKVKLTVQLNGFNVLNDDALIPIGTQPTGQISVYRIPAERRYELSTRFEY